MRVRRPPEVGQFHLVAVREHEILRLQVAMDDIVQMAIVQGVGHLVRVPSGTVLGESSVRRALQMLVQFALRR